MIRFLSIPFRFTLKVLFFIQLRRLEQQKTATSMNNSDLMPCTIHTYIVHMSLKIPWLERNHRDAVFADRINRSCLGGKQSLCMCSSVITN